MAKLLRIGPDVAEKIANAKAMQEETRKAMQRGDIERGRQYARAAASKMQEVVDLAVVGDTEK